MIFDKFAIKLQEHKEKKQRELREKNGNIKANKFAHKMESDRLYNSSVVDIVREIVYASPRENFGNVGKAESLKNAFEQVEIDYEPEMYKNDYYGNRISKFVGLMAQMLDLRALIMQKDYNRFFESVYFDCIEVPWCDVRKKYINDSFIDLLKMICYNTDIDFQGSTGMLNDLFKLISKKSLEDPASDFYGVDEESLSYKNLYINKFSIKDYYDAISCVDSEFFPSIMHLWKSGKIKDVDCLYLFDYASYLIKRDMQWHLNVVLLLDQYYSGISISQFCFPSVYYDENDNKIDLRKKADVVKIDLCQYTTIAIPDKIKDTIDGIADVKNHGFITEEKNNIVTLYKPFDVCVVESGNHHIAAAIAEGSCIVYATVVDLTPMLPFINIEVHDEKIFCTSINHISDKQEFLDGRIALLYYFAKAKIDAEIAIKSYNERQTQERILLARPYSEVRDYLVRIIGTLRENEIINISEIFANEVLQHGVAERAVLFSEKLGLLKRGFVRRCCVNGHITKRLFLDVAEIPTFGNSPHCCDDEVCKRDLNQHFELVYVRTNKDFQESMLKELDCENTM